MRLLDTLKFIALHPANRRARLRAVLDFGKWQIASRLWAGQMLFSWISGTQLIVSKGETGLTGNVYTGLHEFNDMAFVLHFLRSGDIFLDIGANCGSYTVLASGVVGARAISFEPLPDSFIRLQRNVRLNGLVDLVELHNIGLGDQDAELWFSKSLDTANHVVEESSPCEKTKVLVNCLDHVVNCVPDLIKIDVEGFEINVFKGAQRVLGDSRLKAMIVEVNNSGGRYGNDEQSLVQLLTEYGFAMYQYDALERVLRPANLDERGANIIFIRDLEFVSKRVSSAVKFRVRSIEV